MGFKAYAEKSKAKRGLGAYGELAVAAANELVHMGDDGTGGMKWGFITEQAEAARDGRDWLTKDSAELAAANGKPDAAALEAQKIVDAGVVIAPALPENESPDSKFGGASPEELENENAVLNGEQPEVFANNSVFRNMGATLGSDKTVAPLLPTPVRRSRDTAYTIEKNRPEANGIKRPSEGGICRQIWDALSERFADTGVVPSLKHAKEALSELDMVTVSVQYYRWRKFNGVSGRLIKKEEAAPVADGPALGERIANATE